MAYPTTSDGKMIVLTAKYRGDVQQYFTGRGDIDGPGDGPLMMLSRNSAGASSFQFSFVDWVYVGGGWLKYRGASFGDWIDLTITAPATPVSVNETSTGNCFLAPSQYTGINAIVPAAGNGTHDANLSEAVPLPAKQKDGFWDWDMPDFGRGSVSVSSTPGEGSYHLLDGQRVFTKFLDGIPMLGEGLIAFTIESEPEKILPHWISTVTIHHVGDQETLETVWWLEPPRKRTV